MGYFKKVLLVLVNVFQEQIIFGVDRKAEFPLYITASFLMYTPRNETTGDPDSRSITSASSSRNDTAENSGSDMDLFERDNQGDNDQSFDHQ